jgi:hypothetical protein
MDASRGKWTDLRRWRVGLCVALFAVSGLALSTSADSKKRRKPPPPIQVSTTLTTVATANGVDGVMKVGTTKGKACLRRRVRIQVGQGSPIDVRPRPDSPSATTAKFHYYTSPGGWAGQTVKADVARVTLPVVPAVVCKAAKATPVAVPA